MTLCVMTLRYFPPFVRASDVISSRYVNYVSLLTQMPQGEARTDRGEQEVDAGQGGGEAAAAGHDVCHVHSLLLDVI